MKIVAGIGGSTACVIVGPGTNIKEVQDLRGKRIGAVRGSNEMIKLLHTLEAGGVETKENQLTALKAPADEMLALQRGDLDAIITYEPFCAQAIKAGGADATKINDLLRQVTDVPNVILANKQFLEKNPKATQAVINAYVDIWKKFASDRGAWASAYLKSGSGDPELILDAAKRLPAPAWDIEREKMTRTVKDMLKRQDIQTDVSEGIVKLLDYSYLEKATGLTADKLGQVK
jgi:ABC-type nitrate/sulfonate/bicarbonate transport system substrate-binding protein